MHPAASLVVRMVSSISPLSALRATFPVRGDSFTLPPMAFFHRLRGPLLRGCPRHPALRARARDYDACKYSQSSSVDARQLKDLFHRLRGPPSPGMPPASRASRPCAGLRRLQGLVVEFCSCPLSMDLFRPFGAPSPCAGTAVCMKISDRPFIMKKDSSTKRICQRR